MHPFTYLYLIVFVFVDLIKVLPMGQENNFRNPLTEKNMKIWRERKNNCVSKFHPFTLTCLYTTTAICIYIIAYSEIWYFLFRTEMEIGLDTSNFVPELFICSFENITEEGRLRKLFMIWNKICFSCYQKCDLFSILNKM